MSTELDIVEQIAYRAGEILLEGYGRVKQIQHKAATDLVTDYDRRSEAFIISEIQKAFPDQAVLAEESGWASVPGDYVWLVDPLDGTTNFVHGFPLCAVSIALTVKQQPVLGVVYDPVHNELFCGEADKGATLNGMGIRVSGETCLERALVATGFPYDVRTNPRSTFEQFSRFQRQAQAIRYIGSATLNCVWVAAGRLDGYWEYGTKPWDVAAGALIVREAGGKVTTDTNDELFLGEDSVVLSNGRIHSQMIQTLK